MVILELIHAQSVDSAEDAHIFDTEPAPSGSWMIQNIRAKLMARAGARSIKFLTYQLSMVVYWTTMALTGNGELGFDSGEGARETATTSKEGNRPANYPILTQKASHKK